MEYYQRTLNKDDKKVAIVGSKCSRCGYISLNDDSDVWSLVGL